MQRSRVCRILCVQGWGVTTAAVCCRKKSKNGRNKPIKLLPQPLRIPLFSSPPIEARTDGIRLHYRRRRLCRLRLGQPTERQPGHSRLPAGGWTKRYLPADPHSCGRRRDPTNPSQEAQCHRLRPNSFL